MIKLRKINQNSWKYKGIFIYYRKEKSSIFVYYIYKNNEQILLNKPLKTKNYWEMLDIVSSLATIT